MVVLGAMIAPSEAHVAVTTPFTRSDPINSGIILTVIRLTCSRQ